MARTIRTLHHQACTGGSLISRCIAALPAVALVSEVSPIGESRPKMVHFHPLDVGGAFLNSYPEARPDLATMVDIFGQQLRLTSDLAQRAGLELVVRDHPHTAYMRRTIAERSAFLDACASFETIHSLVSVRYPYSSFLSLGRTGWDKHLEGYEDYCRRYLRFLDHHATAAIIQYEGFCADPQGTMRTICRVLDLEFDETFEVRWQSHKVTGNSGRGATMDRIQPLPFHDWTAARAEELAGIAVHAQLCDQLGYPADLATYAREANALADEHAGRDAAVPGRRGLGTRRLRRLLRRHRPQA
jgi:hypothetical protein